MRNKIMPNDTVKHRPSGEIWVVCGVNHESGNLVPMGYPFPSIAKVEDCEPEEIGEAIKRAARESETKTATRMEECIAGAFRDVLEK